jgi:transcriptional regulator of met regulon
MIDANGMRVEAYLDAVTGAVLPYRDDDDDRYERDDDDDRRDRDDD